MMSWQPGDGLPRVVPCGCQGSSRCNSGGICYGYRRIIAGIANGNVRVGVPVGIVQARLPFTYLPAPAPETVTPEASVIVLAPVLIDPLEKVSALVVPFTLTFPVRLTPDELLMVRLLKRMPEYFENLRFR